MIALVISLVLIAGAIQVYAFSRQNHEVNEALARLQETARYALSVMEPDIRMANSWGLVKGSGFVDVPSTLATTNNCGAGFATNLMATLDGTNNQYSLGCPSSGTGAVASADTLVVRRASAATSTVTNGRLLVCSTRTLGRLVTDSSSCPTDPIGQVNDLIVNAYYVARDADERMGLPTLRRWGLASPTAMADTEIVPGVEDMQIQFGVDPTGTSGIAARYVNPGDVPAGAQVVSVRLWLLVRGETPEQGGYTDRQTYEYGARARGTGTTTNLNDAGARTRAYAPNDGFRRLLVSRTIQIRNSMGI
jgi:type IV pilus assembly protein PilW